MDPLRETGKLLVVLGVVLLAVGAMLALGGKLPFRLGRLPGDVVHHGRHGTVYFPIVTCVIVSIVLTLLFWIANIFRR